MPKYDLEAIKNGEPQKIRLVPSTLDPHAETLDDLPPIPAEVPTARAAEITEILEPSSHQHNGGGEMVEVPAQDVVERAYIPSYLKRINFEAIVSQQTAMAQLNSVLPLNDWELPEHVYRADLIDYQAIDKLRSNLRAEAQEAIQMLDAAKIPLVYDEGYPNLGGMPFWQQLSWEPISAYTGFNEYLQMTGVRRLDTLLSFDKGMLLEWFHVYMWPQRVAAYDMYVAAHHQKQKVQLALSLEGRHYSMAGRLLDQFVSLLATEDYIDPKNVTPKQAIEIVERLVKIQRISVGLPANGGQDSPLLPTPISVTMTQISEANQAAGNKKEDEKNDEEMDAIMQDPNLLQKAQELILKFNDQSNATKH